MELNPLVLSLPAIIALIVKGGIYAYARYAKVQSHATQIFLLFLFALSLQNIGEIWHFFALSAGQLPVFEVTIYYAGGIVALGMLNHLALELALPEPHRALRRGLVIAGHLASATLLALLFGTPWLIKGFEPIGYTVTRIPGPVYWMFEVFVVLVIGGAIGLFCYGAVRQSSRLLRLRNRYMLVAMVPMLLTFVVVIGLLHFGIKSFNASIIVPATLTYMLVVTTFAVYQHRLFDIEFFVPWSRTRRRRTAFHDRIRSLIAEIADLDSVADAVHEISGTLRCPVALVGPRQPAFAGAGDARRMLDIPRSSLKSFENIVVTREIANSAPQTHALLQQHGIAAVVPFYPHSRNASGWLLLGDTFDDQVYSPLDFQLVEKLFHRMAELFLDNMLSLRGKVDSLQRELRDVRGSNGAMARQLGELEAENRRLQARNAALRAYEPADSLIAAEPDADQARLAVPVTLIGRDREMLQGLRSHFSEVRAFAGPGSAALRRAGRPEVMAYSPTSGPASARVAELIGSWMPDTAVVLYGANAAQFAREHRAVLQDGLVEIVGTDGGPQEVARRVGALIELQRGCSWLRQGREPMIGSSPSFTGFLQRLEQLAGFREPALLRHQDDALVTTAARYLHEHGQRSGLFLAVSADTSASGILEQLGNGDRGDGEHTVLVRDACCAPAEIQRGWLGLLDGTATADVRLRLVLACRQHDERAGAGGTPGLLPEIEERVRAFTLTVPALRERRGDLPLLIHYHTLQHNLQAGTTACLSRGQAEELCRSDSAADTLSLRNAVYGMLQQAVGGAAAASAQQERDAPGVTEMLGANGAGSVSLDDLVAEYESRIIRQTLERCQGNKSRTARLLGLRPNTLHYKLARHGIGAPARARRTS